MVAHKPLDLVAAIDVGTNAVRLKLARLLPDNSLQPLQEERDAIRPGEGVFKTRELSPAVADRLLETLDRYSSLAKRHGARVRAVATSALREARNRKAILDRVRQECGLELEVISGQEEARLICLGVLRGKPARERSILIDIGGGSTEVAFATGETSDALWSLALGAVRLSELFDTRGPLKRETLATLRDHAAEVAIATLPDRPPDLPTQALGSSGTVRAVVGYAAAAGASTVNRRQLSNAVNELAKQTLQARAQHFDSKRAEVIVAGAVVLEALAEHLALENITAVETGLRDGILVDLVRRQGTLGYHPAP